VYVVFLSAEFNLMKSCLNMFLAGSDTTFTVINWALLFLFHHPHVQDTCFQEICDVIGTERAPSMRDRPEMTYLEATITETLRYSVIAPGAFHVISRDVKIRDYVIPRGTLVFPTFHSTAHDPEVWGDPEKFRPERFISPDGKLARTSDFIMFGAGESRILVSSSSSSSLLSSSSSSSSSASSSMTLNVII
jgi:cytochrome P450